MPYRRSVGDMEGLRPYPGEPVAPTEPALEPVGVSLPSKGRRAAWLLAGGWVLASVSLAGIFQSAWVGLLALSGGILAAGALEVYDLATPAKEPE